MGRLAGSKIAVAIFLLVSTCHIVNIQCYMVGNNPYHRAETLDPDGKYLLEWLVDWEHKRVTFNVTVQTTGYVGFGLSSYGKMSGADLVIGGVKSDGSSYFSDRHAVGHHTPELDPSQDWVLHSARETKNHTFLTFSRAFDTCDPQDYPITEDKISLIWAYGERDTIQYHYGTRGEYPIYLINPDYSPRIIRGEPHTDLVEVGEKGHSNTKIWTINNQLEIPSTDSTYWCTMHKAPRLTKKHHSIGFNVRFTTPEGPRHVHHILIHRCHAPAGSDARTMFDKWTRTNGQVCLSVKIPRGPMPTEYCTDYFHAWAVGGKIYFHPEDVAVPIGDSPDEYYLMQTHYDNPNMLAKVVVDSTIEIFYTDKLRQFESGILAVRQHSPGLPTSHFVPPSSLDQRIYGLCGADCTRRFIPKQGITVYGLLLHTHNSGIRMRLHHFRGNKELPFIASDDTFQFNFQTFRVLNRPVKVLPGDQLVMDCEYDNTWTNGTVVGGYSSRQEMCASWLQYHTKIPDYMQCSSEIDSPEYREYFLGVKNFTWQDSRLEYVVDSPRKFLGMTITEVSDNHVNWDMTKREELQQYQLYHPQANRCTQELFASGTTDEILEMATYPADAVPYRPKRSCSFQKNKN